MEKLADNKKYLRLIWAVSIAIPVVVAILLFSPTKLSVAGGWVHFLPHLNGVLNSATTVVLLLGFYFIRKKNIPFHRLCMTIAFTLGSIFLVSYVIYHGSAENTLFGDANGNGVLEASELAAVGGLRTFYIILLISHIIMAAVVVPFVLLAFYFALTKRFERHKKIVKFTLPIWLYVSITGVLVYLMISPYYMY